MPAADPPPIPAPTQWCVYVLRCGDGSLYTGATNDLAERLIRHNAAKGAAYTRSRLPVELAWVEEVGDRSAALRLEAAIKKLSRLEKIAMVEGRSARIDGRRRPKQKRAAARQRGDAETEMKAAERGPGGR